MSNEAADRRRVASWAALRLDVRWAWLLTAMGVTGVVYAAYLTTHPYPAYAGGLYLEIADQIVRHGYALPERIPGYTADGVPFAYPPLMFYLAAAVIDATGVDPLTYLRVVPGLAVIAGLVPYYLLAEELVGDPRTAGLATVLLGVTPTTLRWHLSSGGMVRAPAFLLALACCYTGLRLFRSGDRRWLVASTGLFGLLVASHPTYTVFAVLSFLLLYAAVDRSAAGLVRGAVVGVGGLLLVAPWWLQVASTHGFDIFLTASGTHGGLGGGLRRLAVELSYPLDDVDVEWPFFVAAYVGGAYALWRRRFLLPAWLVLSGFVVGKARFVFVAGSLLTAAFVFDAVVPRVRRAVPGRRRARTAATAVVLLVVVAAGAAGTLYGAGAVDAAHEHSVAQPQPIDDADLAAMRWIEGQTAPSAELVVAGDAAEWLPYFTDRTILVGPWGVEWESTAGYYHQFALFDDVSFCDRADCLAAHADRVGLSPDYVYVPKGHYTVRGREHRQSTDMRGSVVASDRYEVVYENEGVLVAHVVGASGDDRPTAEG